MIETPAAALIADELAKHSAFFSVGTNDLVQYTLAVDRGNARLAERFAPHHPAVRAAAQDDRRGGQPAPASASASAARWRPIRSRSSCCSDWATARSAWRRRRFRW